VSVPRLLAPFARAESYRTLVHLATAVPLGTAGLVVLVTGWSTTVSLAFTPLVVVVPLAFRAAVGVVAQAEAALARGLLGAEARPPIVPAGRGLWDRARKAVTDGAFWRQQAYLALRWLIGFPLAVGELSLIGGSLGALALPVYYPWSDLQIASDWHVDTLPRALAFVPAGALGLLAAAHVLRPLRRLWRSLAESLLSSDAVAMDVSPEVASHRRRRALAVHAGAFGGLAFLFIVIWALTSRGYFWPAWPVVALALPLAIHGWAVLLEERPAVSRTLRATPTLAVHEGVSAALFLFFVAVWALGSRGYFWPVWPLLGLAIPLGIHAVVVFARRSESGELTRRIRTLEQTRAGAVDVQDEELRRIERDLHDGAQARLVALGMSIGLAEQKLRTDPHGAQELLAEARKGAHEALEELRDLARGIHPPVLTDRGLGAAIATLADRSVLPVTVDVELTERPPAVVETAAYFVVAEALANAAKHSLATSVTVRIRRSAGTLGVEVADDGRGGADAGGHGLTGLRQRVEALDGTLSISSPEGGPTTLMAELPCAS